MPFCHEIRLCRVQFRVSAPKEQYGLLQYRSVDGLYTGLLKRQSTKGLYHFMLYSVEMDLSR